MIRQFLFPLLLLCISHSAQAQLYKWVGSNGTLNYSDKPPAESAARVEQRSSSGSDAGDTAGLPYELTQAVKNMPVTLYSADGCPACGEGRNFLMKNGIPFSEKTVSSNEELDKFKQISGGAQVPILFIGKNKLSGFNTSEWRTTLTQAGYPESNLLPANYRFAMRQPLLPTVVAPVKVDSQIAPSGQSTSPARDPGAFRF